MSLHLPLPIHLLFLSNWAENALDKHPVPNSEGAFIKLDLCLDLEKQQDFQFTATCGIISHFEHLVRNGVHK